MYLAPTVVLFFNNCKSSFDARYKCAYFSNYFLDANVEKIQMKDFLVFERP